MFNLQLDKVEAKEKEDAVVGISGKAVKLGKKFGGPKKKEMLNAAETKPSPQGRRIIPKIDLKLKEKFEKETLSKENKVKRVSNMCTSENLIFNLFDFFFIEFCTRVPLSLHILELHTKKPCFPLLLMTVQYLDVTL
jgi:hypothetical protein